MTLQEFSDQFDVVVNSYRRFKDFDKHEIPDSIEFNEYEKSVYLTKYQEELVLSLYNGRNQASLSFEETEEMRRLLANLVKDCSLSPISNSANKPIGMGSSSKFFTLPSDLWFITYEAVSTRGDGKCDTREGMEVTPVTQDEYHRVKNNPFRGPNWRRALRLDLSDGVVEIVSKYNVEHLYVRYLRKPQPIILEDLPNNLTINGEHTQSACELHEALHQRILEGAVIQALRSKGYNIDNKEKQRE